MTPSDCALLVVLGIADAEPTPLKDIWSAARLIAPPDWQPTSEVIGRAAERAIRDRQLARIDDDGDGDGSLLTTVLGRRQAAALLRMPIARDSGGFLRTAMRVKLCFLHLLMQPDRSAEAAALAGFYRDAIGIVRQLQRLSPALAGPALQDLRSELIHLESEFAWLEGMRAWQPLPQAAE